MGIFARLWNPRFRRQPTCVWLTREARQKALRRAVDEQRDCLMLLVAHFPATLRETAGRLDEAGIAFDRLEGPLDRRAIERFMPSPGRPVLALSEDLDPHEQYGAADETSDGAIAVYLLERHPLRTRDRAVEGFARRVPWTCRLTDCVSLEDPLLRAFYGDRFSRLFRAMGMSEQHVIESRMIERRIASAQRRVQRRALGDERAENFEQWMRRNCPDLSEFASSAKPPAS